MRIISRIVVAVVLLVTVPVVQAASVPESTKSCIRAALNRAAAAGSNQRALGALYEQYFGDALAIRAARPGFWKKFSETERRRQREHAKLMTISVVTRLAKYARTPITFISFVGGVVRGIARTKDGANAIAWHMSGSCSFEDVYIDNYSLAISMIGNYQKREEKSR